MSPRQDSDEAKSQLRHTRGGRDQKVTVLVNNRGRRLQSERPSLERTNKSNRKAQTRLETPLEINRTKSLSDRRGGRRRRDE